MEAAAPIYGSEVPRLFTPPDRELTPETSLADAVELMLSRKIGGLPVVRALSGPGRRQLVGIVTDTDIFRLVLTLWRAEEQA